MYYTIKIIQFVYANRLRINPFARFWKMNRRPYRHTLSPVLLIYIVRSNAYRWVKSTLDFHSSIIKYTNLLRKRFGQAIKVTCIIQCSYFFLYNKKCCMGIKSPL